MQPLVIRCQLKNTNVAVNSRKALNASLCVCALPFPVPSILILLLFMTKIHQGQLYIVYISNIAGNWHCDLLRLAFSLSHRCGTSQFGFTSIHGNKRGEPTLTKLRNAPVAQDVNKLCLVGSPLLLPRFIQRLGGMGSENTYIFRPCMQLGEGKVHKLVFTSH